MQAETLVRARQGIEALNSASSSLSQYSVKHHAAERLEDIG